jgi:ketopantoate reductase
MRQIQLLAHRSENRIRQIDAQHEGEVISLRDSIVYETKKVELDIQQKFSRQLVDLAKLRQTEIDGLREKLE